MDNLDSLEGVQTSDIPEQAEYDEVIRAALGPTKFPSGLIDNPLCKGQKIRYTFGSFEEQQKFFDDFREGMRPELDASRRKRIQSAQYMITRPLC